MKKKVGSHDISKLMSLLREAVKNDQLVIFGNNSQRTDGQVYIFWGAGAFELQIFH